MKVILSFIFTCLFYMAGTAQDNPVKFATINNAKTAYKTFHLEKRKTGEPILVFESGLGSGGGNFEGLFEFLPNAPALIYDRNGIGESAMDLSIKTDSDVVKRLHELLLKLKIEPPYLLVGHSVGGPFVRMYASLYPDEVGGMVLIDPTDFMLSETDDNEVKKVTSSKNGYQDIWVRNLTAMAADTTLPQGMRNEMQRELTASTSVFFKEYQNLKPLKDIPVTILIAYNRPIEPYEAQMNTDLKLGLNLIPWWEELNKLRINHYAALIAKNHFSSLVVLPGYSHGIHNQDPKLVADAITATYNNCLRGLNK